MPDAYSADSLLNTVRRGLLDIGYTKDLLRENYTFAEVFGNDNVLRRIDLAAFAQEPPSYRNSCLGVVATDSDSPQTVEMYRALGAPQLITVQAQANTVRRWKMSASGEPQFLEQVDGTHVENMIRQRASEWEPERILRAKSIAFRFEPVQQLDFFDIGLLPSLEESVYNKLDRLLREVIASCKVIYSERHAVEPNYAALFRLIFRLIAAKLLADRGHPGDWSDPDVQKVIRLVETFYFRDEVSEGILDDEFVQALAWEKIRGAFHFQNISVEALAYVYENTFVTPEHRKKQDIHATPYEIAEYVVSRLPIEELDIEERSVFEPFSGHAPFLIAALGRLRMLLPASIGPATRHDYFVRMLSGMEIDAFAREVARYSLILADYPNPDGWSIAHGNAFISPEFGQYLARSNIVLCNPPYGNFSEDERTNLPIGKMNKAVEALRRVLEHPPKMLGFVLPRVFVHGQSYRDATRKLISQYATVELVGLPKNVFQYSKAETVLLIAYGQQQARTTWRSVAVDRDDYGQFIRTGRPTWQTEASPSLEEKQAAEPILWHTPLHDVWRELEDLPCLEQVAEVHRGIEYNVPFNSNVDKLVSLTPQPGSLPGLVAVEDGLEPYIVRAYKYLNMDPNLMLYEAYKLPWSRPKVIANAHHLGVGRWTIAGAIDERGLVCYQNFHGIWPIADIPIEVLAAVLNGPIANAFVSMRRTSRDNQVRTIRKIPIPSFTTSQKHIITSLVREYISYRSQMLEQPDRGSFFEPLIEDVGLQIDIELLAAYDLPHQLERILLSYFAGFERPGLVGLEPYFVARGHASASLRQFVAAQTATALANIERLTADVSANWHTNVSAVDAVRDVRREL